MTEIIFDENEDWEKRTLCSDESCIGTIGPDGRCRVCGKVYEGKLPEGHNKQEAKQEKEEEPVHAEKDESDDVISDEEWENRVLCPDESCIGVIGPDGKCKVCGKPLK